MVSCGGPRATVVGKKSHGHLDRDVRARSKDNRFVGVRGWRLGGQEASTLSKCVSGGVGRKLTVDGTSLNACKGTKDSNSASFSPPPDRIYGLPYFTPPPLLAIAVVSGAT